MPTMAACRRCGARSRYRLAGAEYCIGNSAGQTKAPYPCRNFSTKTNPTAAPAYRPAGREMSAYFAGSPHVLPAPVDHESVARAGPAAPVAQKPARPELGTRTKKLIIQLSFDLTPPESFRTDLRYAGPIIHRGCESSQEPKSVQKNPHSGILLLR